MTDESGLETHPLDRDYSMPVQPRLPTAVAYYPKLRRVGVITFVAGFVTVFLAAIVLGSFRGSGSIETVGSSIHRFAMFIVLIGGCLIILAYRLPHLEAITRATRRKSGMNNGPRFLSLVFLNIVGFFAIVLAAYLYRWIDSPVLHYLVNGSLTITCALMVTIAVWHRGFIRAYAIGVLVALLMNSFSSLIFLTGGYWMRDHVLMLLVNLVTIQISGLTCAGYVCLMESAKARKSSGV